MSRLYQDLAWTRPLGEIGFEVHQMEFIAGQCPMFIGVKRRFS